jgi:replicative DNA helicase
VSIAEFPNNSSRANASYNNVGTEFERTPPQDLIAEQSVLGGMLLSKDAIADVLEILRERDFYRPAHELIYDAVLDLYGRGEPADAITVSAELTKRGDIARAGGAPYLHTLISSVPTAANASYYAKIVREHAIMRRLVEAGTKIVQLGYNVEGEVDDAVDQAQAEVYAVTERRTSEDYVQLATLLPEALDEIEAIQKGTAIEGIKSGFRDLDLLTHGFHPGNMIILAARPAVGKSTLGLDIARYASIHDGKTSVIFSLEMSRSEITMRMLSAEARVGLNNIRSGQLSDEEWSKLARRMGEISAAPLFIDDSPNLSMMEIRAKARRLKQRHDLKLIVIDYLQLMTSGKRVENRQQEVSEFSRHLKLMAKELNVPVIAISQLNRSPEQRSDKKPLLSDLRESGSIEQDADVVILLHRDDMYDSQNRSGEADLIIAKHRNGQTKTITVAAQLHFARFADMAPNAGAGRDFTAPQDPAAGAWNE